MAHRIKRMMAALRSLRPRTVLEFHSGCHPPIHRLGYTKADFLLNAISD